jgi:hypothetical protein
MLMMPARKVVRIRRAATAEPLLPEEDVDDMLDVFAMGDAEVVPVVVNVADKVAKPEKLPQSGFMRKVVVPNDEPVEELTDGIQEGWDE